MKHLLSTWMTAIVIISVFTPRAELAAQTPIPEIERKAFLNGMQVLFLKGDAERTPFVLAIANGAAFDPADRWGATYLLARMILKNIETKNYLAEFKTRGIEIESKVDWDAIYFMGSMPSSEAEFTLLTLGELLVRPDLLDTEFEAVRTEVLRELEEDSAKLDVRTEHVFESAIFQENPYGHPVKGTPETVRNLELRDIKVQARKLLLPNQAKLALYYSGDRDQLFRRLSRRWGAWVQADPAPFTFRQSQALQSPRIFGFTEANRTRSLVRWGILGVSRNSRDYLAFRVLEHYLTLSLPDWAKEIEGTSQIRGAAVMTARRMPGFLQISIDTVPELESAYIAKLVAATNAMRQGQLNEKRFGEAKQLVLQEFDASLKDPTGCLLEILSADIYGLGVNFIPTFGLRLERLTLETFQKSLQEVLPSAGFVAVVASPTPDLARRLAQFGTVELLN